MAKLSVVFQHVGTLYEYRVFSHPSQINNTYKLDLSAELHPRNEEAKPCDTSRSFSHF